MENEWDSLAEVAILTFPVSNPWLDQVAFLLEAHGVIVHRLRAPLPIRPVSSPEIRSSAIAKGNLLSSILPLNVNSLVFGSRVIETPPIDFTPSFPWSSPGLSTRKATARLLNSLENAQAEVIRWPENDDIWSSEAGGDSPKLHPSDIVILSLNVFITRLSANTNNKGLEYLWSVLARPSAKSAENDTNASSLLPRLFFERPIPLPLTTTVIVHIREGSRPLTSGSQTPMSSKRHSLAVPYASKNFQIRTDGPGSYIPLSRVLIPIQGRIMLYDPSCLASGEARRLKSVLDRLQNTEAPVASECMSMLGADLSRTSSRSSYGTFWSSSTRSSTAVDNDEGWSFLPINGLHKASVLLISQTVALVSAGPPATESSSSFSEPKIMTRVCQVLESLGIQAIPVPCSDAFEQGAGVREAVTVLRREPERLLKTEPTPSIQGDSDDEVDGCLDAINGATSFLWRKLKSLFYFEQ